MIKPMLACDWDPAKLVFPLWVQPKIDGVRALNLTGRLTGRSLKEHKNRHVTQMYSHPLLVGFDGEMTAESSTHPALCRLTTSALNTIDGYPWTLWGLFDYVTEQTIGMPYERRYESMLLQMTIVAAQEPALWSNLRTVPFREARNLDDIEEFDAANIAQGFEGSILRNPAGKYKSGRCTARECNLLRIKRFEEEEAIVTALVEGETNTNEATVNELGQTERSTHHANMIPNGMVGSLLCKDIKTGQDITVAAGCMSHAERLHYMAHPSDIVGKVVKYKRFSHGTKDKPRFPTFQSLRAESDMS